MDLILHLRPQDQSAVPTNAVFIHRSGQHPWTPGIQERSATDTSPPKTSLLTLLHIFTYSVSYAPDVSA